MEPHADLKVEIGSTIRRLRDSFGWTQAELAARLGWSSHVIVGNVESGTRDVKASELAVFSQVFKVSVDSLLGIEAVEGKEERFVLWREIPKDKAMAAEHQAKFLEACDRYTYLEKAVPTTPASRIHRTLPSYSLDILGASFEDVSALAEQVREALNLGPYPANDLMRAIEEDCDVKVIYLSLPLNSGSAACSVAGPDKFIMLNSAEVPWRRTFSLAHELFHLITWDLALFKQVDADDRLCAKNEQLANAFAAALLMPREQTRRFFSDCVGESKELKFSDLLTLARDFQVSAEALLWRLVGLKLLPRDAVLAVQKRSAYQKMIQEVNTTRSCKDHYRSWKFVRLAYQAHSDGRLSKAKFAQFLGVPLVDVYDELAEFGLVLTDEQKIQISDP